MLLLLLLPPPLLHLLPLGFLLLTRITCFWCASGDAQRQPVNACSG
jgi:hypothetical protein